MKILIGDILQSEAQTLINTVNCVGVMGKGIALEFKSKFPNMFADYAERCERKEVKPGVPYLYKALFPPQIVNFPTKDHWKSVSKMADIDLGLQHLLDRYREWGITSLAIPPLGCGNGQLEWGAVGPLIYHFARRMDVPVELYAPYGTKPRELTAEFLGQSVASSAARKVQASQTGLNPAWIAVVEILNRIEKQPYHWPVGRTTFQKIAYVATTGGIPTGFEYRRGSFGPFSSDLKKAETKLVNSNLLQEERRGRMFVVKVGPQFEKTRRRFAEALSRWEPTIAKTADLFMRMNTKQAEIVATVLFAATLHQEERDAPPTETELLDAIMKWKLKRRPPLNKTEVASTIRNLGMLHWLRATPDPSLPVPDDEAIFA